MTIPEVRDALMAISNSLAIKGNCTDEAQGIRKLVLELKRRTAIKVARAKAQPMTPLLKQSIRAYATAHPEMSHREIGRVFNVDGGRVSEALRGFRK